MAYRRYWSFAVIGAGRFPMDMLRYDRCWPAHEKDSAVTEKDYVTGGDNFLTQPRLVRLRGLNRPTEDRWRSRQWRVVHREDMRGLADIERDGIEGFIPPTEGDKVEA